MILASKNASWRRGRTKTSRQLCPATLLHRMYPRVLLLRPLPSVQLQIKFPLIPPTGLCQCNSTLDVLVAVVDPFPPQKGNVAGLNISATTVDKETTTFPTAPANPNLAHSVLTLIPQTQAHRTRSSLLMLTPSVSQQTETPTSDLGALGGWQSI
jgi:hypothetical protein